MWFTRGSLTFKEAYTKTGRALNISVVPSDRHSPTILLNHLTAPNCLIWSAILASAAVPGILNPVVLMAKDRSGNIKPHNLGGSRFKDGSLREDIPLGSLHTQFNCNFSIVSQTNPHIHLFFFAPRGSVGRPVAHRKGKGWRGGFILSALESYIKLDLSKHFKVIRDLDLMPQILQSDWSGVFLQRFSGDLTLTPRSTIGDWFHILSDPDRPQMKRMLRVGERVAWPALGMVRNRMTVERAILRGRSEVRTALSHDRTSNDPATSLPETNPELTGALDHVPIESDVDAGFVSRSRRARNKTGSKGGDTPEEQLNLAGVFQLDESSKGVRRRKQKKSGMPLVAEPLGELPEVSPTHSPIATESPQRNYTSNFGDSFRHVRAPSLPALSSPFRSIRSNTSSSSNNVQSPSSSQRFRSQLSITRWFGGVSESSSDEEDEDLGGLQSGEATASSGEEGIPTFQLDSAVESHSDRSEDEMLHSGANVKEEYQSEESEGKIPIPGGERVTQEKIDSSMASGERLRPAGGSKGSAKTPPVQDGA